MKTSKCLLLTSVICLAPLMMIAGSKSPASAAVKPTKIIHLSPVSGGVVGEALSAVVDKTGKVSITNGKTTKAVYDHTGSQVMCPLVMGAPDCSGNSGSFKLTAKEKAAFIAAIKKMKEAQPTLSGKSTAVGSSSVNNTTTQQPIFGTQIN
jgi:hypothetical protein